MSESAKIPTLQRGGKYREWAAQMEALLITHGLDTWLEKSPGTSKPSELSKDKLAKARLLMHVSGGLLDIVRRAKTTKTAWDALKSEYQGFLKVRRPRLMNEVAEPKQRNDSIVDYIDRAKRLRDELDDLDLDSDMSMLSHQFVRGMNYEVRMACAPHFNTLLNEGKGLDELAIELQSIDSLLPRRGKVNSVGTKGKKNGNKKEVEKCAHCGN
jgi:hypothetical protein